jgi:alginate O-acetyltransferase complex protein AlgJ
MVIAFLLTIFGGPWFARSWASFPLTLTGSELHAYEETLAELSVPRTWEQPRLQTLASLWGGFGNSKVVVGRDGWLFYKPDVELLTNPPKADPLPAFREFHQQLAARGIKLLLMPAPSKATIHPEALGGTGAPLYPHWWSSLRRQIEAEGVAVFDPAPLVKTYLKTDTHWQPEAMELVARELAKLLSGLPVVDEPDFEERSVTVTNAADIAVMLGVTYPKETVSIRQVRQGRRPWESSDDADVLVLGDSYANIYSGPEIKWGKAAGLAEQPDRLTGKRVVIWEFSARELEIGDWKLLPVP